MSTARKQPDLTDHDNPEWTAADFARARGPESLSAEELAAFPRTRGPQKAPTKKLVSVRLSPVVIEYFKGQGDKGWQARMDAALVRLATATTTNTASASAKALRPMAAMAKAKSTLATTPNRAKGQAATPSVGVQFGPAPVAPGSRLKKTTPKGTKR